MVNSGPRSAAGASKLARKLYKKNNAAAEDRLYRRLSALGPVKGAVGSTINEYIREGKTVSKTELEAFVKELRKRKKFQLALEIMEWMEDRKINFAQKDYPMRLDLIAKAKGITAAENYLSALSPRAKVHCTYGAFLYCYCEEKMTDKALALFAKMVKENMISKALPFNNLMCMYIRLGQPEKAAVLARAMKEMNIQPDTVTYNLLMNGYSCLNDIEGVEKVFEEMKLENGKQCDWTTYSHLASVYVRGGYREKADMALNNLEKEMNTHDREAFHFLISLYAGNSDLHNVHRIWKSLKSRLKVVTNKSYLIMLQALTNLNDINGLKKCYEEWESVCSSYDLRLTNTAIGAYLTHGMLEEAESILRNATGRSKGPFFKTWEMLMNFFLKNHQIKQALQIMEIATHAHDYRPQSSTVDSFLNYFKAERDVGSAEEFYQFVRRINCVDRHVYKSLLETYVAAGKTSLDMRERIEGDAIEISSELEHLLASVCPK